MGIPVRIIALTLFITVLSAATCAEPASTSSDAEIERQVKLLGSDDFGEREAAEQALAKFGILAERALLAAEKSVDAEVRSRAARCLVGVRWQKVLKEESAFLAGFGPVFGASKSGGPAPILSDEPASPPKAVVESEDRILDWLARAQEKDGHWDAKKYGAQTDADVAQTALALMVFLNAGHSEKAGTYKANVKLAVSWLRQQQREDGAYAKPGDSVDGITHALAGDAMAQAGGFARTKDTLESAQNAVSYSIEKHQHQTADGPSGFTRTAGATDADLLTTLFFIMQLRSAKISQLRVPVESLNGIYLFLATCEAADGKGYSFLPGKPCSPKATLTGCAVAILTGTKKEDIESVVELAAKDFVPSDGRENSDALFSYLGTYVMFQQGGVLWKSWSDAVNADIKSKLVSTGPNAGSWNPSGVWASGGRVLTTSLHALCYVYYRRFPQP